MPIDKSLYALIKISKPQKFPKGTMICREGMPGTSMYIVMQGRVGIYISTLLDERMQVNEIASGGFFGEMAMFDDMPRSATCIAIEDTVCVSIDRTRLRDFIVNCPDLTESMLIEMSKRLRSLDNQFFKSPATIASDHFAPFVLPSAHHAHDIEAPPVNEKCLRPFTDLCPVCQKEITLHSIQTSMLSLQCLKENMRRVYKELNVLWHYIWSCPECGYTNFNTSFQQLSEKQKPIVAHIVSDQMRFKGVYASASPFDELVFHYYQAIHLNECINGKAVLLLGKLWLYLHWLYSDADDTQMAEYTRERAISLYEQAINDSIRVLRTPDAQQQCAQVLAELYIEKEEYDTAWEYYHDVTKCGSEFLKRKAHDRMYQIREMRRNKNDKQGAEK